MGGDVFTGETSLCALTSVLVVSWCGAHVPRSALQRRLTLFCNRVRLLHQSEIWPCFIATQNL